jgi:hypothetical protein
MLRRAPVFALFQQRDWRASNGQAASGKASAADTGRVSTVWAKLHIKVSTLQIASKFKLQWLYKGS